MNSNELSYTNPADLGAMLDERIHGKLTPQQRAIRQFLVKPPSYSSACGCMGPQPIEGFNKQGANFELAIVWDATNRAAAILAIHTFYKMSLAEAKIKLDTDNQFSFKYNFEYARLQAYLSAQGIECVVVENPNGYYPVCQCSMSSVEMVDDRFYRVTEVRGLEAITFEAKDLGPVGGPYLCDSYGRMKI